MAIINTKGVEVYLQVGSSTATTVTPTDITKASPTVVEVASVTGIIAGDVVSFSNTGFTELDGKTFAVGAVTVADNSFTVLGADTANSTGVLTASIASAVIVGASDMVKLCLSSMEIGADSVNNIDVSTYCDTAAQIPGKSTPGTITLAGYADKDDVGLAEVIKAAEDQQVRAFEIVLPNDNGYIVGNISLAGLSYGVPLEGAVTFTVSGTQNSKIRWVYGDTAPAVANAVAAGPTPVEPTPEPAPVELEVV